jgi:hypothetical protein
MQGVQMPDTVGLDRRTLIKRSAAAGAIAWVAPTVFAQSAHANAFPPGTTCTPRCTPTDTVNVSGTGVVQDCIPGIPPGQQDVEAIIQTISAAAETCPCGGDAIISVTTPAPGTRFEVRPKPGNVNQGEFDLVATISCTDGTGDVISRTCSATATAFIKPGNCNSDAGIIFNFSAAITCGDPSCQPA